MIDLAGLSLEEFAAYICQTLGDAGIRVALSGGSCVTIWSENKYQSQDLDFIEDSLVPLDRIAAALRELGFVRKNKYFTHPEVKWSLEFPPGPLTVGDAPAVTVERQTSVGTLRLLSPTDCVKDRLAPYYFWNDAQGLEQALAVATTQKIDLKDLLEWSSAEGEQAKFEIFRAWLKAARKPAKRRKPR